LSMVTMSSMSLNPKHPRRRMNSRFWGSEAPVALQMHSWKQGCC
jgi:hypothetical protein